jgi:multidrug efflux pump subunit AcrB
MSKSWFERKKACLCISLSLCFLSIFILVFRVDFHKNGFRNNIYTVTQKHYGIDTREIERTIAIPLEDSLSSIPGVQNIISYSQNGTVRAVVRFDRGRNGQYEAVREAAQSVYETLPTSAQRPEILSSDNSRIPVWSAAVFTQSGASEETAILLERIIKPRLETLEGSGEVEITGSGITEIVVALNAEKSTLLGITPATVAAALEMNDILLPGGIIEHSNREITISVDGHYQNYSNLENAFIPLSNGGIISLNEIASVFEQEREPEIFSRLNGKKAAIISIMGSSGANLGKLSREIKNLLHTSNLPLDYSILSDRGAEETAALNSVLLAALQGSFLVALMSFLICKQQDRNGVLSKNTMKTRTLVCALSVPVICIISAASLTLFNYTPDRFIFAGLSAGIGSAVDAVIICSEYLRFCRNIKDAKNSMRKLYGPLIAGSVTTIVSLIPLISIKSITMEIQAIAWAIGMVTFTSLILSITLIPPIFLWGINNKTEIYHEISKQTVPHILRCIRRIFLRFFSHNIRFCTRRPEITVFSGLILTIVGVTVLCINGTDTQSESSEDSVYAHIEFKGGLRAEEADRLLGEYSENLFNSSKEIIKNIQTSARTASGSMLIAFNKHKTTVDTIRSLAKSINIPEGFIFFPETSQKERNWEIKIFGDDDNKCREIAQELAGHYALHPDIKETVLNFKEGSKKIIFSPDRERFVSAGISFSATANTVRWGVHGPVAYKRINTERETDVRVRWGYAKIPSYIETRLIPVKTNNENSPLVLDSLMNIQEKREPSGIKREDRRRTASITIVTKPMDPRQLHKSVSKIISTLQLPPGYSVEFDREAIKQAESVIYTFFSFLTAILFCYMVIASINESFILPLAILSIVPPSLAVPAIFISVSGHPFNTTTICAFIAVSGMAVNASVLCTDNLKCLLNSSSRITPCKLYLLLRERLSCLLATGSTTIAGSLPFLFLAAGSNTLIKDISLVTVLGVFTSCLCSITVLPSMLLVFNKLIILFISGNKKPVISA